MVNPSRRSNLLALMDQLPTHAFYIGSVDILLNPAGWLTSSIISAAQSMLKEQHGSIGDLQDPCLAQSMGFRKVSGEFVQVIHNRFGHWLTVTNIGAESDAEVMAYDSLYPSIGTFV